MAESVQETVETKEEVETDGGVTCATQIVQLKVTPAEVVQQNTSEDDLMMEKMTVKFGEALIGHPESTLIRFVRGYAHEEKREEATIERLEYYVRETAKLNFLTILDKEWPHESVCSEAWKCFIYGQDKEGHPVVYDEIGCAPTTEIDKAFGNDVALVKTFRLRFMKALAGRKDALSKRHGCLIYKHSCVMDMSQFSSAHFGSNYRNFIKETINAEQHLFPETLHKLFIVNAPWAFRFIWTILSAFIDPITYEKVVMVGGSYLDDLLKEIDSDEIPKKYGGTGTLPIVLMKDAEDAQLARDAKTE